MTRTAILAALLVTGCGRFEVAGKVEPELLVFHESTPVRVCALSYLEAEHGMTADGVAWWNRELGFELLTFTEECPADVTVEWGVYSPNSGECRYDTGEVSIGGYGSLDVGWQILLHEIGHCGAGLPHHWSSASIMVPNLEIVRDPFNPRYGEPARIWYGLLPGERRAVRAAYGRE